MDARRFLHVYNRGTDRREIYRLESDYARFIVLLTRYLDGNRYANANGRPYPSYAHQVKLHAYCLMPNHFHLLLEELEPGAITAFIHSLKTAYCRYFNLRHGRSGVLFETHYRSREIEDTADLLNVSRYIHLNPKHLAGAWSEYAFSSLRSYKYDELLPWLETALLTEIVGGSDNYVRLHQALPPLRSHPSLASSKQVQLV